MGEAKVKDGPTLVIDQMILFQLLGDELFYRALPPGFDDLADQGRSAYKQAVAQAMDQAGCNGCTGLKRIVTPVQVALGRRLAAVQSAQPEALVPLVRLITEKRGYRPRPVLMFYQDEAGKTRKLEL